MAETVDLDAEFEAVFDAAKAEGGVRLSKHKRKGGKKKKTGQRRAKRAKRQQQAQDLDALLADADAEDGEEEEEAMEEEEEEEEEEQEEEEEEEEEQGPEQFLIPPVMQQRLSSQFTPAQRDRYAAFRKSRIPAIVVRTVMSKMRFIRERKRRALKLSANNAVKLAPKDAALIMGTITKVYIGQLVEESRRIMTEWGHVGPIRPKHIREAYRRLQKEGVVGSSLQPKANVLKRKQKARLL